MNNFDFVALDVETANSDRWSICQVGLAFFEGSQLVDTFYSYVNPETYFDSFNESIHGISESMVRRAPKLSQIYSSLKEKIIGKVVVHHTAFDRVSLIQLADHLTLPRIESTWLDTSRMARYTFPEVRNKNYSLESLCSMLKIENLQHHDALNDAIVAGKIFIKILESSNRNLSYWIKNQKENFRLWGSTYAELKNLTHAEPDPKGILFGDVIVFTGALELPRIEAAKIAYDLGCDVDDGITKKTTILVVGDQDARRLAGYSKSSKHRKAEDLINQGQHIEIIGESDFLSLVGLDN